MIHEQIQRPSIFLHRFLFPRNRSTSLLRNQIGRPRLPALLISGRRNSKGVGDAAGDGTEAQVTWEDQQNINRFGRLNNRLHELDDEIRLAKEANENLDDAGNELILSDEDVVRFQIGEVFAHMPRDDVETRLEQMKEDAAKKLERLEEEKESILSQMAELKKILYAKFKDAINLEED